MPRHDWKDDETMSREHSDWRSRDRGDHGRRERGRGAFFDRDDDRDRRREENRRYGSDDHNGGIPMDETRRLIASNKIEGTPVYDRNGDKIGTIHNFMVDKRKGQVVYAVLRHGGGFLGLGERYYPLEWDHLTFDTHLDGYHVNLDEEDLQNFGSFDSEGRFHRRSPRGERDREREASYGRDRW